MLSTSPNLLRLSQGQLNLLERCPRQFQHTYLEQLNSPADPEHEERQTLGSRFHLLMQQREIGLPIDSLLQADSQLQKWMSAFASAAPDIVTPTINNQTFRESEHYRTLQVQDYLLTVIYDLLIADNQQAQILDWKTYPKPPDKRKLAQNWQTRLYMYVLAETSEYLPENISMTYWFVQSEGRPQNIKYTYDNKQHQQTAKELNQLLNNLTTWLKLYQKSQPFPQVIETSKACNYCQFAVRCQRTQSVEDTVTYPLLNIDNIQEVTL
ncbi:PD-(D/E)XK nuclease family protein [Nostoc spongiaeforme FACHB-130]|uniref:PD-(D/E)XK nuclease family protein n=1 Tax=Nostoc spongiaeforme FACHB-130 TaxID=1357510 RepID=A0ABR8FZV4_9NOSO|nr:PD-(D/E)XK nuclease family protein [Nostoc spongiaeforme]MBD2596354.1 PD-(D/E)XK nuclease family protein [Nostoc spongiaeforme FACHB-130]